MKRLLIALCAILVFAGVMKIDGMDSDLNKLREESKRKWKMEVRENEVQKLTTELGEIQEKLKNDNYDNIDHAIETLKTQRSISEIQSKISGCLLMKKQDAEFAQASFDDRIKKLKNIQNLQKEESDLIKKLSDLGITVAMTQKPQWTEDSEKGDVKKNLELTGEHSRGVRNALSHEFLTLKKNKLVTDQGLDQDSIIDKAYSHLSDTIDANTAIQLAIADMRTSQPALQPVPESQPQSVSHYSKHLKVGAGLGIAAIVAAGTYLMLKAVEKRYLRRVLARYGVKLSDLTQKQRDLVAVALRARLSAKLPEKIGYTGKLRYLMAQAKEDSSLLDFPQSKEIITELYGVDPVLLSLGGSQ